MLFKSLFLAALLMYVSTVPVGETTPAPATTTTTAADAVKLKPPSVTKTRSELASAIIRIMLNNRIGGVPVQCMPHKTYDALICNFPSVLSDDMITAGIAEIKNMSQSGFENIQYVAKTKKGNSIIKWGSCKNADGTPQAWNAALGLTRIFGGKSCTVLHLSAPPPEMKAQAAVAQQAVATLLNSVKDGGAPAPGGQPAATESSGQASGQASGQTAGAADQPSGASGGQAPSTGAAGGWVKGADGKWTKPT